MWPIFTYKGIDHVCILDPRFAPYLLLLWKVQMSKLTVGYMQEWMRSRAKCEVAELYPLDPNVSNLKLYWMN